MTHSHSDWNKQVKHIKKDKFETKCITGKSTNWDGQSKEGKVVNIEVPQRMRFTETKNKQTRELKKEQQFFF